MNNTNRTLGAADFVIGMVLIPLVIGLFALAVIGISRFNDKLLDAATEKEESPACYADLDVTDNSPGTPHYASDYEGGADEALAACDSAVEVEVNGDVMIWRTMTGIRMCILESKVPSDVMIENPQTHGVFHFQGHLYVCPIKETAPRN